MLRRFLAVLLTLVAILAAGWLALRRPDIPFETLEAVYTSPESRFVTLEPGVSIHYRDQGNRDGPVLVLVHGFSSSLHTWEPWVRRLEDDFRIVSMDLPGHGLSRVSKDEAISITGFVDIIDDVATHLNIEQFVLAGSSMGGNAAWSYALSHGDRLEGLILVGASGWSVETGGDDQRPLIFKLIANPFAREIIKDLDLSALVRSGLEKSFFDASFVTEEMVLRYSALSRAPGHRDALLKLSTGREGRTGASADRMATISVPTLVIHGVEDRLVPVTGGQRFVDTIPDAAAMILTDIGHLPQEEAAQITADRVRAFVRMDIAGALTGAGEETRIVATDAPSETGANP